MSEHETSIRAALHEYSTTAESIGSDAGAWSASEAEKALDALLSKHRAELKAQQEKHTERMRRVTKALDAAGAPTLGDCSETLDVGERVAALVAELRRDVETARAAALNEAADTCEAEARRWGNAKPVVAAKKCAERIRSRITTPAPATIPVERVREVLRGVRLVTQAFVEPRSFVDTLARRLDVPLDAEAEVASPKHEMSTVNWSGLGGRGREVPHDCAPGDEDSEP